MEFKDLNLPQEVIKAIEKKGFINPTAIQEKCIPLIQKGKDVVGQSLTGSGKTAAFGLPMLQRIEPRQGVQALILVPTRELAVQVCRDMAAYSEFMNLKVVSVYGGVGMGPQIDGLKRAEIVVATPGRMLDHLGQRTANLGKVHMVVLDEADKMFEMGFIDAVKMIFGYLPVHRQNLLFSATMPHEVVTIIKKYLKDPVFVKEELHVDKSLLKQVYYNVKHQEKYSLLVHLLKHKTSGLAIVFCATRRNVDFIYKNLRKQGIAAMAVHGGLSQNQRSHSVDSLKNQKIDVLVATDVAARGLDISNVTHIYNYDSPRNSNEYTHRIGRTARAGKSGEAITLLSDRDYENFRNVMSDRTLNIEEVETPAFEKVEIVKTASMDKDQRNQQYKRRPGQGYSRGRSGSYSEEKPRSHFRPNQDKRGSGFRSRRY